MLALLTAAHSLPRVSYLLARKPAHERVPPSANRDATPAYLPTRAKAITSRAHQSIFGDISALPTYQTSRVFGGSSVVFPGCAGRAEQADGSPRGKTSRRKNYTIRYVGGERQSVRSLPAVLWSWWGGGG